MFPDVLAQEDYEKIAHAITELFIFIKIKK